MQHSIDISPILLSSVSITPWIYESQLSATGRVVYLLIALQVIRRLDLWLGRKCWSGTLVKDTLSSNSFKFLLPSGNFPSGEWSDLLNWICTTVYFRDTHVWLWEAESVCFQSVL